MKEYDMTYNKREECFFYEMEGTDRGYFIKDCMKEYDYLIIDKDNNLYLAIQDDRYPSNVLYIENYNLKTPVNFYIPMELSLQERKDLAYLRQEDLDYVFKQEARRWDQIAKELKIKRSRREKVAETTVTCMIYTLSEEEINKLFG